MSSGPKRVLIVDDHPGVAAALFAALRTQRGIIPLGPSASLADGLALAPNADAVVLDLNLSDSAGLATVEELRRLVPGLPIVVYSADEEAAQSASGIAEAVIVKGELRHLVKTLATLLCVGSVKT